jgi:hypothetical protein
MSRPGTAGGGIGYTHAQSMSRSQLMNPSQQTQDIKSAAEPAAILLEEMSKSAAFNKDVQSPNDYSGRYAIFQQKRDKSRNEIAPPFAANAKLPAFLKYARQVLKFSAYYKESVTESVLEKTRVHKCEIFYYIENDTVEIVESKQENSGMPQGIYCRRQKIESLNVNSFKLGGSIEVYSRRFYIIDANASTKKYVVANYQWQPNDLITLPWPTDAYTESNALKMMREAGAGEGVDRGRKMHEMKEFMEVQLGKPTSMSDLGAFLSIGSKTLTFDVIWDDTSRLYGDVRSFKLLYFLADDTIEVLPINVKNDGRASFPKLLKRGKVPKNPAFAPESNFYTWRDFTIGSVVNIYSRPMQVVGADASTRKFYAEKGFNVGNNAQINVFHDSAYARETNVTRQIPPYNGFGSEEDSLRSCTGGIKPTPPKKNFHYDKRGLVLRFNARLVSRLSEDKNRRFVIQSFLEDDTTSIREPPIRNSGVIGGNFLRRQKNVKPNGETYLPRDFHVGAILEFSSHKFVLLNADEYTYRLMETEEFPHSIFEALIPKLQQYKHAIQMYFVTEYKGQGIIAYEDLRACLSHVKLKVKNQEIITIWRKIDKQNKGKVSFTKLLKAIDGIPLNVRMAV